MLNSKSQAGVLPRGHLAGRRKWIAGVLTLLLLLLPFSSCFDQASAEMDEGMVLVYPEMIHRGALPYRDFETFYGPANPFLLSGAFALFGTNITVERAVGLFYRLLILGAVFAAVQRWGTAVAVVCTSISGCLMLPTGIVAFAWMGSMMCALWCLYVAAARPSRWRCFGAGVLGGLALLFRVDVGPAMILGLLPLIYGMSWRERGICVLGAGIALSPLVVLAVVAGPQQLFDNLFALPVLQSSSGRHLPLFSAEPYLVRLLFVHLGATAVNVVAGAIAVIADRGDRRNYVLLAMALFSAGVTHQAVQRLDTYHLLFAAFISIGLLPLSAMLLATRYVGVKPGPQLALFGATAAGVLVCLAAPPVAGDVMRVFRYALQTQPNPIGRLDRNGRSIPLSSPAHAETIARMLDELDRLSVPGERLFIGPGDLRRTNYCDTILYHMMPKLYPATYFLEMNPLSANRANSRLAADIASADWLILNRMWDSWREPNRSKEMGPDAPNRAVQENFTLVAGYGSFGLFRRSHR